MTWLLTWLNVSVATLNASVATLNATLQLLVIYRWKASFIDQNPIGT